VAAFGSHQFLVALSWVWYCELAFEFNQWYMCRQRAVVDMRAFRRLRVFSLSLGHQPVQICRSLSSSCDSVHDSIDVDYMVRSDTMHSVWAGREINEHNFNDWK
jgi:hypothetical protein